MKLDYRPDIDGLRALAVSSVFIFHLNPSWLPGGFVGVDVFFVISGYLITQIIYKDIQKNDFTFTHFYYRRMKRILPAFFTVIFSCLVFSAVFSSPDNLISLGISSFSTIFFISNFRFAMEPGGYFNSNEEMPLLHTWSLAVEEQYYFIWPIILIFLFTKLSRNGLLATLLIFTLLSFILGTRLSSNEALASWSYYSLPTRAGELLIGSILAILISNGLKINQSNNLVSALGLVVLLLSMFLLDESSVFPGYNALWPCIGTALLIASGNNSGITRILSCKTVVFIGIISYPIYLWHWPVIAFTHQLNPFNQENWSAGLYLFVVFTTLLLSYLTWQCIEKKARYQYSNFRNVADHYWILPSTATALAFWIIVNTQGLPQRFSSDTEKLTMITKRDSCSWSGEWGCSLGDSSSQSKVALLGDSHAQSLETFFDIIGKRENILFGNYNSSSCTAGLRVDDYVKRSQARAKRCAARDYLFNNDIEQYQAVILVGRWETRFYETYDNSIKHSYGPATAFEEKLEYFITSLIDKGKKVYVIKQVPKYNLDFSKVIFNYFTDNLQPIIDKKYFAANSVINEIAERSGATIIDFSAHFCVTGKCYPYDENGIPLYKDDDHLNIHGAEWLANKIKSDSNYKKLISDFRG